MLEEYRHPDLVNAEGRPLELDLFFPELNIAFEYQVYINVTQGFIQFRGNNTIEL